MTRMRMAAVFAFGLAVGAVGAGVLVGSLKAQTPGFERAMLLTGPIAASTTYEAHLGRATIGPGFTAARHFHHGDEIGVVLEGEAEVDIEGRGVVKIKAGEAFHIAAGVKHTPRNAGTTPAKVISIWIVEKGKPLAVNAP